jgi:hypothetical protein
MADLLPRSLMENLITILAFDKDHGDIVSKIIDITLMDGDYRLIAEKCIDYWRTQQQPPGDHLADLFSDILDDKHNRRGQVIKRHIRSMIALSESINTKYVMQQLRDHNRLQRFKAGIVEAAEIINKKAQVGLGEVEALWDKLLRTREIDFQSGMRLDEPGRVLQRLEELASEFRMGISELDKRGIVPARGKLLILGGAAGRGKTWGLIHIGVQALQSRKRVVHITCEIDEEEVVGRYYQSMFSIAKRPTDIEVTELDINGDGQEGAEHLGEALQAERDQRQLNPRLPRHARNDRGLHSGFDYCRLPRHHENGPEGQARQHRYQLRRLALHCY